VDVLVTGDRITLDVAVDDEAAGARQLGLVRNR
jgi:hypothetical protein